MGNGGANGGKINTRGGGGFVRKRERIIKIGLGLCVCSGGDEGRKGVGFKSGPKILYIFFCFDFL